MSTTTLVLEPPGSVSAETVAQSWSYTRALGTGRAWHTATLLSDGRVLVVGGINNSGVLNSAELYNPATVKWSVAGDLNEPRALHTATLLESGKVMVVGGYTKFDGLFLSYVAESAELYDPAAGTWSSAGKPIAAQTSHTATLLPNGKVLIAGGGSNSELYDPTTGTWSVTGSPEAPGVDHTATLLPDGKVLVVGGALDYQEQSLAGAELYDPSTGVWAGTGSLNTARAEHTATLLPNGDLLVAGGGGCSNGFCTSTAYKTAELYNTATGTWSATGGLNTGRFYHAAAPLASGQVLVAGGIKGGGDKDDGRTALDSTEVYDPAAGKWSSATNLNVPRFFHTATLLQNGKVLVVGGNDYFYHFLQSAELFDPDSKPAIPRITLASVSGKKLIVVGEDFNDGAVILLNDEEQITKNDGANPQTALIAKKAGKKIKAGDKLQVRNSNGAMSQEFTFTGP